MIVGLGLGKDAERQGTTRPQAHAATTEPAASQPADQAPPREDALPGVVELSDGRVLAGWLYTTQEKPFSVYVDEGKQWRRIPFECVLSIAAVIVEEKMELSWRWKATGEPERVYTGKRHPTRLLKWRFHLIDGSYVEGTVKGQPVWAQAAGKTLGPYVLHERSQGQDDQTLKDLLYAKRIIISRRLMEDVLSDTPRRTGRPS